MYVASILHSLAFSTLWGNRGLLMRTLKLPKGEAQVVSYRGLQVAVCEELRPDNHHMGYLEAMVYPL